MESWLKDHTKGALLSLYIQPGASKTEVSGVHDGRLKVRVQAAPREGEANECLIEFLSELLEISKKKIHLIQGESSRQKQVLVELPVDKMRELFHFKCGIDF